MIKKGRLIGQFLQSQGFDSQTFLTDWDQTCARRTLGDNFALLDGAVSSRNPFDPEILLPRSCIDALRS